MSRESDFYRANVSEAVDRRLVHHAALAVQVAQAESREYPDLELDAVPPLRRLNFQSALLFSTYPAGADVVRERHSGGSHVAVRSGGVTITSLTRSQVPRSVRFQPYQETLATEGQLQLDLPGPRGRARVDNKLWGLMFYGGRYRSPRLTVCKMMFPTPDGGFAPGTIDLISEYPDVVSMFDDEEYAQRQVMTFLELRKQRRA